MCTNSHNQSLRKLTAKGSHICKWACAHKEWPKKLNYFSFRSFFGDFCLKVFGIWGLSRVDFGQLTSCKFWVFSSKNCARREGFLWKTVTINVKYGKIVNTAKYCQNLQLCYCPVYKTFEIVDASLWNIHEEHKRLSELNIKPCAINFVKVIVSLSLLVLLQESRAPKR